MPQFGNLRMTIYACRVFTIPAMTKMNTVSINVGEHRSLLLCRRERIAVSQPPAPGAEPLPVMQTNILHSDLFRKPRKR
jgi:hypothetical protein